MSYLTEEAEGGAGLLYYLMFPPTLTSGPIHKYLDFKSQLNRMLPMSWGLFREGTYRITRG